MSRNEQIVQEALDAQKPGLREWKLEQDERIDAEVREQIEILDRGAVEKMINRQSDAQDVGEDPFIRDGIMRGLGEVRLDHAMGVVTAEQEPGADPDHTGRSAIEVKATPQRYRKQRDPSIRFNDEVEALRYWWSSAAETRSGDFDRIAQRVALGATIQSSTRNTEPRSDAYLDAIRYALSRCSNEGVTILGWVHLEFARPAQRAVGEFELERWKRRCDEWMAGGSVGARPTLAPTLVPDYVASELLRYDERQTDTQARERLDTYHKWVKQGRKQTERMVHIPASTPIEPPKGVQSARAIAKGGRAPDESKLTPSHEERLRWEHLVAERLGMNISGALGPIDPRKLDREPRPPAEGEEPGDNRMTYLEASSREVRARYLEARRTFRDALQRAWLDFSGTSLQKGGGSAKYIIPAPTSRELDADAQGGDSGEVECCAGVRIENGVRLPCAFDVVDGPVKRHPSRGWKRCDVCDRPVYEGMVAA